MNEQQLAAVKQALEALELHAKHYPHMQKGYTVDAIEALQSIISQDALYKMAEDAVTIGLSYNDWPKIGCVNHDCDQCKAVQEPVACVIDGDLYFHHEIDWEDLAYQGHGVELLYTTPPTPQPVPVKTYHDGKPWPVAPKPWVGLSRDEVLDIEETTTHPLAFYQAIEAKLKEKNT
jgi:hypothetical protein